MTAGPAQAARARFDIADIVRAHRAQLEAKHPLSSAQKRVLTDIEQCRTAALGGHVDHCPSCGYEHPSYNSCRNRHCPKCQALAQEHWIEQRRQRLLDVGHFHVVFTLPAELRPLAQLRPARGVPRALPRRRRHACSSSARAASARGSAPRSCCTPGRASSAFHPHVHAIVTAGGLALEGQRFVPRAPHVPLPRQGHGQAAPRQGPAHR